MEKLPAPPVPAAQEPDVRTDRLCKEAADPDAAADKIHIDCRLETGIFASPENPVGNGSVYVAAYNLERGMELEKQIQVFKDNPDFSKTDVLLIGEADRGCSRTGYRNIARELAKALGMNYVFGVEYIELPRKAKRAVDNNETVCEHGNAILTRGDFKGIEQIRHAKTADWYIAPGPERDNKEPRLGGCMAIAADIEMRGKSIRAYAVHYDNGFGQIDYHTGEATEIVEHSKDVKTPVVVGGDMNTVEYINDLRTKTRKDKATWVYVNAGFVDPHLSFNPKKRATSGFEYGVPLIIDLLFVKGADVVSSGLCSRSECGKLSDHLPVWAQIEVK